MTKKSEQIMEKEAGKLKNILEAGKYIGKGLSKATKAGFKNMKSPKRFAKNLFNLGKNSKKIKAMGDFASPTLGNFRTLGRYKKGLQNATALTVGGGTAAAGIGAAKGLSKKSSLKAGNIMNGLEKNA